jgi:hypothetical protein
MAVHVDPAMWRAQHEVAARRARSLHDLVSLTAQDSLDAAIRLYVEELYRMDVTQIKTAAPKRRGT